MLRLLVIDHEVPFRNSLKERLVYEGYRVGTSDSAAAGRDMMSGDGFDVLLCDRDCFEAISLDGGLKESFKGSVLVVTNPDASCSEADMMKRGAYDVIRRRPCDLNRMLRSLRECSDKLNAVERETAQPAETTVRSRSSKSAKALSAASVVADMIGDSDSITHLKAIIEKVAPSDARVLVMGENGTGKELVARWVHEKSNRRDKPFVEVNCAAIPSELIESELFGHEKGAFTSAVKQRKGRFEQANGGTLFLDEIGDMSLPAQAKVLRALQERKITRVGGDADINVDVRVVAATNKNLRQEIARGNFREDLYHRLSVIVLRVPSLSERKEDIPMLVHYFIDKISADYGVKPMRITDEAIAELVKLKWTGNIRELRNVVERLLILCDNEITDEDVRTYTEYDNSTVYS